MGEAAGQTRSMGKRCGAWWWLALSVLVGLVTTVAVAWVPVGLGWRVAPGPSGAWIYLRNPSALGRKDVGRFPSPNCLITDVELEDSHLLEVARPLRAVPAPAWVLSPRDINMPIGSTVVTAASGWPLPAFRSVYASPPPPPGAQAVWSPQWMQRSGALARSSDPAGVRALPYLPYWPGLLTDTTVYTAVVFLLGTLLTRSGRWHRCRRGSCERCGYSLAGLTGAGVVCPECGAAA
jgi:hypothetical protein